jgi:uncharacterized protein
MIPSRFNVTVADFPGTGKHILYNTRSQAQVVIDDELRDSLAALPGLPAKPETRQAFSQLGKMGFVVSSAEADDTALEAFFAKFRDDNSTLRPTVLTTYACNFGCVYCVEDGLPKGTPMTAEAAETAAGYIIDQFKRFGSRAIALTFYGGEPLLNMTAVRTVSRMLKRFSEIEGVPFGIELSTNGSLLTPEVVQELIPMGLTGAKITLDGPRDVHDSYRPLKTGKGSFDLLLRNIESAAALIEIKIEVNVDTGNSERIGELLDVLSALGLHKKIHELIFCPITPTPRDRELARPSTEVSCAPMSLEYAREHITLQRLALEKGFPVDTRVVAHVCEMLIKRPHFIIDPTGVLSRCGGLVGRPEFSFGRIGGAEDDRYMGMELWRRCAGCAYAPLCGHGCPFGAYVRYGDPLHLNCAKESVEYAVREDLKLAYRERRRKQAG